MTSLLRFDFPQTSALAVEVEDMKDLGSALATLGLRPPRPTVVVVGGAGGLSQDDDGCLRQIFVSGIVPVLQRGLAAAMDGGTDSGVMRLAGEIRASVGATYPLVGVAAVGTVRLPGRSIATDDVAELEPHHTHFVLVPGDAWGAETPWITRTASVLAAGAPTVTVLVNGGTIALDDVEHSVRIGRPVLVIAGSGRAADALADALAGRHAGGRERTLVESGLVSAVAIDEPAVLATRLAAILGGSGVLP